MRRTLLLTLAGLVLALLPFSPKVTKDTALAAPERAPSASLTAYDPYSQSPLLFKDENQTVYLTNLERRAQGLPPLRWNRELTASARWHSWDFVEHLMNWSSNPCGHGDSQGGSFSTRAIVFGYVGFPNAENVFCGYPYHPPETAMGGWMNSEGHRKNILNASSNEIGLGIYKRDANNWTMYTQVFGDSPSTPLIVENEKPSTTSSSVTTYQWSASGPGEITQMGQASWKMLSNDACFEGATWQPYAAEQAWTLASGEGWRKVYSRISDKLGRTSLANDTIYLGSNIPAGEMNLNMLSQSQNSVTIYGLNGLGHPYMQFSPGWIADDTNPHFEIWDGTLVRDSDDSAVGKTAVRLSSTTARHGWLWQYGGFPENIDLVAYVRLKTSDNTSPNTIFSAVIGPGAASEVKLDIKGTDFRAPYTYQEFAVPIRYFSGDEGNGQFMRVTITSTSNTTVWFDAVTFFTAGVPVQPTYTWTVPNGVYGGEGIWVRYSTSTSIFSDYQNAITHAPVTLAQNVYLAARAGQQPAQYFVPVTTGCGFTPVGGGWLNAAAEAGGIKIWADAAGLAPGTYQKTMQVKYGPTTNAYILVTLSVLPDIEWNNSLYIPSIRN